mmetsp:Transcript_15863/g.53062  ORF Transcript_15863/g.53062 Transcript_15863/m.53062 type:complete len:227 (+) Transcript_15863:2621-3301(+)
MLRIASVSIANHQTAVSTSLLGEQAHDMLVSLRRLVGLLTLCRRFGRMVAVGGAQAEPVLVLLQNFHRNRNFLDDNFFNLHWHLLDDHTLYWDLDDFLDDLVHRNRYLLLYKFLYWNFNELFLDSNLLDLSEESVLAGPGHYLLNGDLNFLLDNLVDKHWDFIPNNLLDGDGLEPVYRAVYRDLLDHLFLYYPIHRHLPVLQHDLLHGNFHILFARSIPGSCQGAP